MPRLGPSSLVRLRGVLAFALAWLVSTTACSTDARANDIPPELRPWVPWVLEDHPDHGCVRTPSAAPCVWAGDIEITADDRSGSFRMRVWLERASAVVLPGGPGHWPVDVRSDTGAATVRDEAGRPKLFLPPGGHVVSGRFAWSELPQSLSLPPELGSVSLVLRGEAIGRPAVDSKGILQLNASGATSEAEGDAVELDVTRHITDGVPVRVRTRIDLRVAGGARELDLGAILLDGTRPVDIEADLPVRIGDGQRAVAIQARPGTWTVSIDAVHEGPVAALTAPAPSVSAWPATEYWSVATDDAIRSVHLQGGAGIDPARTPIPAELHTFPAFLLQPGDQLAFEEMQRGVPNPPSSQVEVQRELWIDADGGGITVRDRITGRMESGWRLDVRPPLEPGHVAVSGTDQVITNGENGPGVALRDQSLSMVSEGRLPSIWSELPAVGWDVDADRLQVQVHVPPGWSLLTVTGADEVQGTAWSEWELLFVFVMLVAAGAAARVLGLVPGGVVFATLLVAGDDSAALAVGVLATVGTLALHRWQVARPDAASWSVRGTGLLRLGAGAATALVVLSLVSDGISHDLFPTLDGHGGAQDVDNRSALYEAPSERYAGAEGELDLGLASMARQAAPRKMKAQSKKSAVYQTLQIDPTAVVQTGPGVPGWAGHDASLSWQGRVDSDHSIRLWLLPPALGALLAGLRFVLAVAVLLLVLGVRRSHLAQARSLWQRGLPWVVLAIIGTSVLPSPARAEPSAAVLTELEARLTEGPSCGEHCVSESRAWLRVTSDDSARPPVVRLRAEAHAVVDAGWAIPGPHTSWQPTTVRVDSGESYALRRGTDGFLYARVPAGVHMVTVEGRMTNSGGLTLEFVEPPHSVRFDGPGYRLGGVRRDGTVDNTLQITRIEQSPDGTVPTGSDNLSPRVTLRRSLDLGIPWRVTTEVTREGPLGAPLSVEVPLLTGEAVTDAGREVRDGKVLVTFDGTERTATWTGTLALADQVSLVAPTGVPWSEEWVLACSPIFECSPVASAGLAPVQHVADGKWQPVWRPWPGERLDITIRRPESISGQTVTIDRVTLATKANAREAESTLDLVIRTSQGGQHPVELPDGAEVLSLKVDGRSIPARVESRSVGIPLQPGRHNVQLTFRWPSGAPLLVQSPAVDLGAPAVNVDLHLTAPGGGSGDHWPLLTWGPRYGPKVLHGLWVGLLLAIAVLLGRLAPTERTGAPFRGRDWALLLLGLTTMPLVAVMVVIGWTLALIVRRRRPPRHPGLHNLFQLMLLGAVPVVGGILLVAVASGLLTTDGIWVANHTGWGPYAWSIDRSGSALDVATLIYLPGWTWRGLVLAWSLWLVVAIFRRGTWIWGSLGAGGWFRSRPKPTEPPPDGPTGASSPTPSVPSSSPADAPAPLPLAPDDFSDPGVTDDDGQDETVVAFQPVAPVREPDGETDEILTEPDSWAPDETDSFDPDLLDVPRQSYAGPPGASVSLLDQAARNPPRTPAVELPYDPDRHVDIGPPPADEDAIFIPALDADPADYAAATTPGRKTPDDDDLP